MPGSLLMVTTTYLAMFAPDQLRPRYMDGEQFQVRAVDPPDWRFNRHMYCSVGEAFGWKEKRLWTDAQWRERVEASGLLTFRALWGAELVGYFELRDDQQGGIEIEYFGLLPGHYGRGLGGALLTRALEEAWRLCPERVWVHTCTLDHPAALANYEARGLRIYRTEMEGTGPVGAPLGAIP
jgi:GNAT superfamily N-acetyltransferase